VPHPFHSLIVKWVGYDKARRRPVSHPQEESGWATTNPTVALTGPRFYTEFMLDYEISPAAAAALLKEKAARLIDVREPWEFSTAHIEGSLLMPMGEVPSRAHQDLDPEERLVVLCHHGIRSMNVTVWLRNQGFEHAQSIRGGIDAWSAEVDPAVSRY
jgi:rhodanese-related sulfurtransferase